MTAPFPFDAWAKPGKDAFDFWISFFPTAPLFGVEWRFAELVSPAMNPLMQAGTTPFVMPFPGTRAAGAAARPGELDTPARADEREARPVARASDAAADAAAQATRVAADAGKAAARTAGAAAKAGGTAPETARAAQKSAAAADRSGEAPEKVAEIASKTGEAAARTVGKEAGDGAAKPAERAERKGEARAAVAEKAKTAVEAARPAADKAEKAEPEAVEAAIGAGPKPKMLLSKKPGDADDLKTLKGVGPGLEKQLNGLGVWKLEQIAKMSDADLAWVDANLTSFKGRCFRDDWVGQAKSRLAK